MSDSRPPLSYRDAGVDIDAGNSLVERIKPAVRRTRRPEVLGGIGGFGGLFRLPVERYTAPVLVSGTDGVGTKLRLAIDHDQLDGVGIDLVAMCVNDILVCGAEPLYFLDYYATGKLQVDAATRVIQSIAKGCELSGMALLGGETAEMPGMYEGSDFDLAGFAVGIVEHACLIDGSGVAPGQRILGLAASGPHSNGYSLIRRVMEHDPAGAADRLEALMAPTRIYAQAVEAAVKSGAVQAMAHITGGGMTENLPRSLPPQCSARLRTWEQPEIFQWLAQAGNIAADEMLRTFNCGVGFVMIVDALAADDLCETLRALGETVMDLGEVVSGDGHVEYL